ncbi:MAG: WG repeat-containing protein, partial [Spirochaetaceae bacterium]|nr:WG repeat-containing protein [Spirochaetaceae bacterium]
MASIAATLAAMIAVSCVTSPSVPISNPGTLRLAQRDSRYGFVDAAGAFAIAPAFEEAREFSEGLAAAKEGGSWGFVDAAGRWAIAPAFAEVRDFHESLAAFKGADGLYGYIDGMGDIRIAARFTSAGDFQEGAATIAIGDDAGAIALDGRYQSFPSPEINGGADAFESAASSFALNGDWSIAAGRLHHGKDGFSFAEVVEFQPRIFGDYQCSAKAQFEGGDPSFTHGLVLHYPDKGTPATAKNWILFGLNSLGQYCIFRVRDQKTDFVIPWKKDSRILTGKENSLAATRQGNKIRFFINGYKVAWIDDPRPGAGYSQVGLFCSKYVSASFDDFAFHELDPKSPFVYFDSRSRRTVDFNGIEVDTERWKTSSQSAEFLGGEKGRLYWEEIDDQLFRSFQASVNLVWGSGAAEAKCGLIFNYRSKQDFCMFWIEQSGHYGVARYSGGAWKPMGREGDNTKAPKTLRVTVYPFTLSLSIDGYEVIRTENTTGFSYVEKIGVMAEGSARVTFQDLEYEELFGVPEMTRRVATDWPGGAICVLAFSPNGKFLAVGNAAGGMGILDTASYSLSRKLDGFIGEPISMAFSADSRTLAVQSDPDGTRKKVTIGFWDPATGSPKGAVVRCGDRVGNLALSPEGEHLAMLGSERLLYDTATGTLQDTVKHSR